MSLIVRRETQGDGEESPEEESPVAGTSGDASAQTGSEEVRRGGVRGKEEGTFCDVSIM